MQIVAAARSFRITGTAAPISVTSATDAVTVSGLRQPSAPRPDLELEFPPTVWSCPMRLTRDNPSRSLADPIPSLSRSTFDGVQEIEGSTLVTIPTRTLDAVADAIALAINDTQFGLIAENIDGGRVVLSGVGTENVLLNLSDSVFSQLGIAGLPTPAAVVIPLDGTEEEIADAYAKAFSDLSVSARVDR